MRVELDLLSGRANPAWRLTEAEADEAMRLVASLADARTPRVPRPKLGYRGLILTPPPGSAFTRIVVAEGLVRASDASGRSRRLADAGRALERQLLVTGRGRVPDDVLDAAERDLLERASRR